MSDQTLQQAAKDLAARYYNSAGQVSCQFVIKLKKMTPEGQALVNDELNILGLPPYDVNAPKKRSGKVRKVVDRDANGGQKKPASGVWVPRNSQREKS
jgi:hypothetical protein